MKQADINKIVKYSGIAISILVFILLVWKFTFIVWYIVAAAVISFIGAPLVKLFKKIKFGKKKKVFPSWLAAALSLLIIIIVAASLIAVFVPVIIKQANVIASIDFNQVKHYIEEPVSEFLHQYNIIDKNESIITVIENRFKSFIDIASLSHLASSFIGRLGKIIMGVFSTIFIAFFFLKDDTLFQKMIMIFVPQKYNEKVHHALNNIKRFLTRYFIGLICQMFIMFTLESIGMFAIGVKGALLIGAVGGFCNMIPYLGPILGGAFGVIVCTIQLISIGAYDQILLQAILVVAVFALCNFIDNTVLQPVIYSNSVNAHPLEIFLVLLVFGSVGGIFAMFLAVPGYTVLKVIAKEFLSKFEIARKWTSQLEIE
ncbi:MAG: AI-2E family transporter [Bacteroidales bacterium]|jgi:predicted PurR-regulated permease PerM|nr:AI-2E family transporter [Bacteroidales bacterium]